MDFKEYFDSQTEKFYSSEMANPSWSNGQYRYLDMKLLDANKDSHILDMACGDGVGLKWFKEHGFTNVIGVELSPKKAEEARRQDFPVVETDIHKLPFKDKSFDIVYSSHTIEHCYDPITAFKEIHRIMVDNGRFYLILPYPDNGDDVAHLGKFILKTTSLEDQAQSLVNILEGLNFKVEKKEFDSARQPEVWLELTKV